MTDQCKTYKASLVILSFDDSSFTDAERDERISRLLGVSDEIWEEIGDWVKSLFDSPATVRVRSTYADMDVLRVIGPDINPDKT